MVRTLADFFRTSIYFLLEIVQKKNGDSTHCNFCPFTSMVGSVRLSAWVLCKLSCTQNLVVQLKTNAFNTDQFPTNQFRLLGVHPHYSILKWCRQQVTDAIFLYRKFILTLKVLMKWNLLKTINELSIIHKEKKWNLQRSFSDHLPSWRKFINFEHKCLKKMLVTRKK